MYSEYRNGAESFGGTFGREGSCGEILDGYDHDDHDLNGTSTVRIPTYTAMSKPLLSFQDHWNKVVWRIPMEERGTSFRRPGRVGRFIVSDGPKPQYPPKKHGLTPFHCYGKNHSEPACIPYLQEIHRVLKTYEVLSPIKRFGVTSTSCLKVKKWFESLMENITSISVVGSN